MRASLRWHALLLAPLALSATMVHAASLEKAIESMQTGRTQEAEREFRALTREASADPAARQDAAHAYFYLGAMEQAAAEGHENARGKLRAGQQYYESALAIDPRLGGALNNLARTQLELGAVQNALRTIDQAVALKDGRDALYLATRADIVEKSGDVKAASAASKQALLAAPQDAGRREMFVRLALIADPASLVSTVDELLKLGESLAAQSIILGSLANAGVQRERLFERLADALAAQSYDPRSFADSSTGRAIGALRDDAKLGAAARELLALHSTPSGNPREYRWWTRGFTDHGPRRPDSPAPRLQHLAGSLGRWFKGRGTEREVALAVPYVEIAFALNGDSIEPRAFLELATIYGATGRRDRLLQLSNEYTLPLFHGKMEAYRRAESTGDYRGIYDFHMALGAIYGYLEQWTDRSGGEQPTSAIFQLQRARWAAGKINEKLPADSEERVIVPTAAIQLLATAYERTNRTDDSLKLRIDAANERVAKSPKLANEVLMSGKQPVDVSRASPLVRADFEKMQASVARRRTP
jgi:predicted negative regulator of RcsB-dependent stress response